MTRSVEALGKLDASLRSVAANATVESRFEELRDLVAGEESAEEGQEEQAEQPKEQKQPEQAKEKAKAKTQDQEL